MIRRHRSDRVRVRGLGWAVLLCLCAVPLLRPPSAWAQQPGGTGTVTGKVTDENGAAVGGAQVFLVSPAVSTASSPSGTYTLTRVPAGTQTVHVRMLGFRPDSATMDVAEGGPATHDFSLSRDPLQLQTLVVTGTQSPRTNLDASVAVTTITGAEAQASQPRSSTEMLRTVPGFTRVESSGGEVNQNITMRGILGVEYVAFLEDGLPVFPTMHTFFMNADNLFRFDENVDRLEVVRGGSSPLFGSNTPGAIVNFLNKTGGDQFAGTTRVTAGTEGLARYDLNIGGPLGDDWRFNIGGFYRYDHGVRDPGYPGIRGGQIKANVTRLLSNGYLRASVKHIDDQNQFILDLPFTDPNNPTFVTGFGDYGSMNTAEGLSLRVPTPVGDLTLPLDNGLKTLATWGTVDLSLQLDPNWHLQNSAQVMTNAQEWNAIVPFTAMAASDYATTPTGSTGLGLPAGTTSQFFFTNVPDSTGKPSAFNTANGLVAPGGEWHVSKPLSAVQDQLTLRRQIGRHSVSLGAYVANYSQDNHWYFTDILTDVRDNPHFLDVVVTTPGGTPDTVTKNGFRHYLSNYVNGHGQTSIVSGVLGTELQLTRRLRADLGGRVEYDDFVQSSENTSTFDLDGDSTTTVDNEVFGNGSFRHFGKAITEWSASAGLNYVLNQNVSFYTTAARGYKMPALDEFLNASSPAQVALFESRVVKSIEGGVKFARGGVGVTLGGFYTRLSNIVSQGAVVDSVTGATTWIIVTSPENNSYGAELEAYFNYQGFQVQANSTLLKAELGTGAGADIGSRINGVPTSVGNLAAQYTFPRSGFWLRGDMHYVADRPVDVKVGTSLPAYQYFNFGAGYIIPRTGTRINLDLLNAFQSKGLEEGNPRLVAGANPIFLARPLLPRRLQLSVDYAFGSSGAPGSAPAGAVSQ